MSYSNRVYSGLGGFSSLLAGFIVLLTLISPVVLANEPAIEISSVRVIPTGVRVAQPFDFEVMFRVTDSARANSDLSAVLYFEILKDNKVLFTSQRSSLSCVSNKPETWRVHMNPVNSKGLYALRAHVSYQNFATEKLVELAIGVPPPKTVVKTDKAVAKPDVKPQPKPMGVIRVRHILLRTKSEALQLIAELSALPREDLKAGFIAAASSKSIGPSRTNGGDLGYISRGRMVASFDRAAFGLAIGQMTTSPIKTGFGYHLIYREE